MHALQTQKKTRQSAVNGVTQKHDSDGKIFQFVDNRRETVTQRKLQSMANNRPMVRQLNAIQLMTNYTMQAKNANPVFRVPMPVFSTQSIASEDTVQRLQVRETLNSYLQGNPATKENIRAYYNEYEIPLMVQRVNEYSTNDEIISQINGLFRDYQIRFSRNAGSTAGQWDQVATTLKILVEKVNQALNGLENVPTGYDAANNENWESVEESVVSANKLVEDDLGTTKPQKKGAAVIKTIPWSSVKSNFPITLVRLLRDIFGSWRSGKVMDERAKDERDRKKLNSDTPGALRSWHMNTSQTLPPNSTAVTPANATSLEQHYQATSDVMNALGVNDPEGPIGFAEYTGTGILNDAHNSKIILDYKRGEMYLTLTHYQYWTKSGKSFKTQGQAEGTNSPWFKIDMNS